MQQAGRKFPGSRVDKFMHPHRIKVDMCQQGLCMGFHRVADNTPERQTYDEADAI